MVLNYEIDAIELLLDENAILSRYFPLIPLKKDILFGLKSINVFKKSDCFKLTDEKLMNIGLKTIENVRLFKRFLSLYDVDDKKLKEIEKSDLSIEERNAFKELFLLPGVKITRARLYYLSGYKTLADIAKTNEKEMICRTQSTIKNQNLNCFAPLPKEIRTQIVVAKAIVKNY